MRRSGGERFTLLTLGFVFVACIATLGGLFLTRDSTVDRDSVVDGVLDATWAAPTTNTDGSPLTDLASYRVYYSTTGPPCFSGRVLTVASSTARPAPHQTASARLTGLTMGQLYYVAVASVNSRGVQSGCSTTASARARRP